MPRSRPFLGSSRWWLVRFFPTFHPFVASYTGNYARNCSGWESSVFSLVNAGDMRSYVDKSGTRVLTNLPSGQSWEPSAPGRSGRAW